MATYLSTELGGSANQTVAPVGYKPRASVYGGRLKRLRATVSLATQTTSDILQLGNLPAGAVFAYGVINSTVSLGTSTLAVGVSGATGQYRAAATFTSTDTPTMFGTAVQQAGSDAGAATETTVIGTIAVASLPASGTLVVDLYYSLPN